MARDFQNYSTSDPQSRALYHLGERGRRICSMVKWPMVLVLVLVVAAIFVSAAHLIRRDEEDRPLFAWANRVGTIADEKITEASGVAASRRFSGIYWIHN